MPTDDDGKAYYDNTTRRHLNYCTKHDLHYVAETYNFVCPDCKHDKLKSLRVDDNIDREIDDKLRALGYDIPADDDNLIVNVLTGNNNNNVSQYRDDHKLTWYPDDIEFTD